MNRRQVLKGIGSTGLLGALASGSASADGHGCWARCCQLCTCPLEDCRCKFCLE